jgi:hypothetical protein
MGEEKRLKEMSGVRGWLFLLCLNLTVLDPLAILSTLFAAANGLKPDFERYPALFRLILISGVCRLGLAVFSVYSGIALWRVMPGAVSIARKYLKAVFAYSAFALFLPGLVGLPEDLYREMAGPDLMSSLLTLAYAAAWYIYLRRSKRVEATYMKEPDL